MASNTNTKTAMSSSLPSLKIGSRVRCTDDGVEGHITWANGVSVKVQWDDGEQVTWRRDSLGNRPIEILAATSDEEQQVAPTASQQTDQSEHLEKETQPATGIESASTFPEQSAAGQIGLPEAATLAPPSAEGTPPEQAPPSEPVQQAPEPSEQAVERPETPPATVKQPRKRKAKTEAAPGGEKKLSALDAAAKVLGETGQPMNCQEMIAAMAEKGYWASPGGKTPAATLYSAILREITTKGESSRFQKTERGKFSGRAEA